MPTQGRPVRLFIDPRSRRTFYTKVVPRLTSDRYRSLVSSIAAVDQGHVVLSHNVTDEGQLEPVFALVDEYGIPRHHVRIRHETARFSLPSALSDALTSGALDFGGDVAERDDGLSRYFVVTPSFNALRKHDKHIVLGPKGSGKSALLREIASDDRTAIVITPEHYATDVLKAITHERGQPELAALIVTWKYTLLVEIFRRLIEAQVGDSSARAELRRYLVDRGHLGGGLTLFERFLAYLRKFNQLKAKVGPAEVTAGLAVDEELGKFFKMDELLGLVPALQRIIRRHPLSVYVDELDQAWDNSPTANHFLIALLTAALQLRGLDGNLHVVVFLRSEIFDLLKDNLPQLDKLRSDTEVIRWTSTDLTKLVASRAIDSIDVTHDVQAADLARQLFPATVKTDDPVGIDYIISRTARRPREVIQFCRLALSAARALGLSTIDTQAVLQAEEEFSNWKLEHIAAEYMYIYPRLRDLLESFRGKSKRMTHTAMFDIIINYVLEVQDRSDAPVWLKDVIDPAFVIKILYDLEVIGIAPMVRSINDLRPWESFDFSSQRPQGRAEHSPEFLVHPALWRALELQ